jgi:CheY-like chemotaxis protein
VVIDLPLETQLHRYEPAQEGGRSPHGGLRILVVADRPGLAGTTAALLRSWGHEIREVADEPPARRAGEIDSPDVVLLEGAGPWDLVRYSPGHPAARRPLMIALAEHARDVNRRRAGEVGIDLVLVQPIDLALLRGVLSRFGRILMPAGA